MGKLVEKNMELPEIKVLLEMLKLSNIEAYSHSLRVSKITESLLQSMAYSDEEKNEIIKGALLHDIGKLFVPLNLSQSPIRFTPQELDIVKTHAVISYEIVKSVFSKIVQNICLYHHEKPNGRGYMSRIQLCNIPDEALLVQVADVYDALTSARCYKTQYSSERALTIMEEDADNFLLDDRFVAQLKNIINKGDMEL